MITLKFPLGLRPPTPEEWRAVWVITGVPPGTQRTKNGRWSIPVPEERVKALAAFLQALAFDLGFTYALPSDAAGWLPWSGEGRPVPARCFVEYKDLSGRVFSKGILAGDVPWGRVVAYRRK